MKIVEIALSDIVCTPVDCSAMLTQACRRQHSYRVTGCVSNATTLFVVLEPGNNCYRYRFAEFPSFVPEEISADLGSRYQAGFTTLGSFIVKDKLWGLFATAEQTAE